MGVLDEEAAQAARGTADILCFDRILQDFLDEQVGGFERSLPGWADKGPWQ